MEFSLSLGDGCILEAVGPKFHKVLQIATRQEDGVQQSVAQEQHEKLVIVEGHAVVDPGAMVVHFEDAGATDGAVMASIGLDSLTFVAVPLKKCF